jgi:hypothetical protein
MFFHKGKAATTKTAAAVNKEVAAQVELALSTLDAGIQQVREARRKVSLVSKAAAQLMPQEVRK